MAAMTTITVLLNIKIVCVSIMTTMKNTDHILCQKTTNGSKVYTNKRYKND